MLFSLSWYGKHVFLPLLPFVIGLVIRSLAYGGFSVGCVGVEELSFSMGGLALLMLFSSAGPIDRKDAELSSKLQPLFWGLLIGFTVFFALATYFDASVDSTLPLFLQLPEDTLAPVYTATMAELTSKIAPVSTALPMIRLFVMVLGGANILSAVILKERLNLTD